MTYSLTRFAMYESLKKQFPDGMTYVSKWFVSRSQKYFILEKGPIPFYQKVFLAGASGACGGFVGTPGDMVNVRMQNDMKLSVEKRRK